MIERLTVCLLKILDVLQPEKRFDFLQNLPIDTEAALRHVMLLAHSVSDEQTASELISTAQNVTFRQIFQLSAFFS